MRQYIADNNFVDFTQNWEPQKIYDQPHGLECYTLKGVSLNEAYGWLHNTEHGWYHHYFYDDDHNDFTGCQPPQTNVTLNIQGFPSNFQYKIIPYYTRAGAVPNNFPGFHLGTSEANGNIPIPQDMLDYLGCDTTNGDMAFSIVPFTHQLQKRNVSTIKVDYNLDASTNCKLLIAYCKFCPPNHANHLIL